MKLPRWIDNYTVELSARLYHKFDNARGSNYARAGSTELDALETMEKYWSVLRGVVREGPGLLRSVMVPSSTVS